MLQSLHGGLFIMEAIGRRSQILDIVYIGMFVALIAVSSWISIPSTIPWTLQTLGVYLTVLILGGKRGTMAVLLYILVGLLGIPVFSGMRAGVNVLFGLTGGYIIGFVFLALCMWMMEKMTYTLVGLIFSMLIGLIACYSFGTIWFMMIYHQSVGTIDVLSVLNLCVFPFVIFDLIKICIAVMISRRIQKHINIL